MNSASPGHINAAESGYPGTGLSDSQPASATNELFWKLGESDELKPPIVKLEVINESQMIKEGIPISTYLKGFPNTCQLSYKTFKTEARLVRSVLENSGFFYTDSHNWNVLWSGIAPPEYLYESLNPFQKINHFPSSNELTRKDKMCLNLKQMIEKHGPKYFDFVPETFVLPEEFSDFYSNFMNNKGTLWIVKPSCSSQGRGIYILDNIQSVPLDESCIISKYVRNPYLINGLKFDLRIYALISSFQPLRIYVYKEGLARFASEKYANDMTDNKFVHLTNYSVNKKNQKFVQNTDAKCDGVGHKWSLKALMKYLSEKGVDVKSLWGSIYDIIIKSVISIENNVVDSMKKLGVSNNNCFDLLGFDILIDSNLKPWLLEVNLSPSLATDSPLDFHIKSNLITDTFNLIGIYMKQPRKTQFKNTGRVLHKLKYSPYLPPKPEKAYLTKEKIIEILRDTLEEFQRKGNFICIFPCKAGEIYEQLLETSKKINRLVRSFLYDKSFEISQLSQKPKKNSVKKTVQNSFELQINAKSLTNKTIITGDDILQEYLNRCQKLLKISNNSSYPESLKTRLDKFFNHYSWKTSDSTEKSTYRKLFNRMQEMSQRKSERQSKSVPRRLPQGTISITTLAEYSDEELSSMLVNCNKEVAFDLITILTEGEGVLSMLSRFSKLKELKRTKSPFIDRRINSLPQRPKTSNKIKYVF